MQIVENMFINNKQGKAPQSPAIRTPDNKCSQILTNSAEFFILLGNEFFIILNAFISYKQILNEKE